MDFSIFNYNVFFLWDESNPLKRARAIAEFLRDSTYDVLCFTECFSDAARAVLLHELKSIGYAHATPVMHEIPSASLTWRSFIDFSRLRQGLFINGGLIFVSRWPILTHREKIFRIRIGAERWCPKGIKYITVEKLGRRFHLFGTHLQADDSTINMWKWFPESWVPWHLTGRKVRMIQLKRLKRYIHKTRIPASEPVFVLGDMNVNRDDVEFPPMLKILNATHPPGEQPLTIIMEQNDFTRSPRREGFLHWIEGNPFSATFCDEFVDYVLVSNSHLRPAAAKVNTVMPRTPADDATGERYDLSDHYAVEGIFRFW